MQSLTNAPDHCDEVHIKRGTPLLNVYDSDTCTYNQQEAIRHFEGPCMVLAGPGSGKTFVITRRIKRLIEKKGVDPLKILVITFSKAAAEEMKARFQNLCGEEYYPVNFGTFHAIFFQILKRAYQLDGNHIVKEHEKRNILMQIVQNELSVGDENDCACGGTSRHDLRKNDYTDREISGLIVDDDLIESVLKEISVVKNQGGSIEGYHTSLMGEDLFRRIYVSYKRQLAGMRKLDFDDMVLLTYELFSKRKDILSYWQEIFSYILIDEFQDINAMQFRVVRQLSGKKKNLFVVGDDDQSIYGFRGSKPEIMLNFEQYFQGAKRILLDQNFRSDGVIVDCSLAVIGQNKNRFFKDIKPSLDGKVTSVETLALAGEEAQYGYILEQLLQDAKTHTLSESAVLFRMNQMAEELAELLSAHQIPYRCKEFGKSVYDHFIMKDYLAYYRLALGEQSRALFYQIMNKPVRYLKRSDVREGEVSFSDILSRVSDRVYVVEKVRKLSYDLKKLSKLEPFPAFIYLRKAMGYDEYLKKLAREQGVNAVDYLKIADSLCQKVKAFQTLEDLLSHIEVYERERKKALSMEAKDAVTLMTMHSAKGLEWKKVYIPLLNEGVLPSPKALSIEEVEEERRLFYVAMTRAKEKLVLLYDTGNKENPRFMSRFLNPIIQRLSKMSMNFSTNC